MFSHKHLLLFLIYWFTFSLSVIAFLFSQIDINTFMLGAYYQENIHFMNDESILVYSLFVAYIYNIIISHFSEKNTWYRSQKKLFLLSWLLDNILLWLIATYALLGNYIYYVQTNLSNWSYLQNYFLLNPIFYLILIVYLTILVIIRLKLDPKLYTPIKKKES